MPGVEAHYIPAGVHVYNISKDDQQEPGPAPAGTNSDADVPATARSQVMSNDIDPYPHERRENMPFPGGPRAMPTGSFGIQSEPTRPAPSFVQP